MNQIKPGNQPTASPISRHLRILGIFFGACLFVWLQLEVNNIRWVLIFSATICTLTAARVWLDLVKRIGHKGYLLPLAGLLAGIMITPVALLLMAIKTGLHGHLGPDFTGEQLQMIILGTPIWLISGFLVGIGFEFFWRANQPNPKDRNQL